MAETQFVRFVETNDNEGETWTWWLPLNGNEIQIGKLAALLDTLNEDEIELEYEPHLDTTEPESVVDKLVEHADDGYYRAHNKVLGRLACPDSLGDRGDVLYKGGIRDLFTLDSENPR